MGRLKITPNNSKIKAVNKVLLTKLLLVTILSLNVLIALKLFEVI
jgi:hypothetical protein